MKRRDLDAAERVAWLRLIRSENVGPVTFFALLSHFGDAAEALRGLPDLARRGGRRGTIRLCGEAEAHAEIEALERWGGRWVAACEPDYPLPLAAIHDPPPLLAVRGPLDLCRRPSVAVVGARNASANGRRFARTLAADLGQAGVTVVSGLARGIDAEAHASTLETGTVAVMAGGIDVVYPPENEALYARIVERGILVSEQPFGLEPRARHFPRRNRLISGLSHGVVVVEATAKSGSLITARLALDQGREVFAVPGSPLDPRAKGPNGLIRDGATLVESAADVLRQLQNLGRDIVREPPADHFAERPPAPADESDVGRARVEVLGRLGPTPVTVDELLRQCQVSAPVLATVLLELELAGRLERSAGARVALVGEPVINE